MPQRRNLPKNWWCSWPKTMSLDSLIDFNQLTKFQVIRSSMPKWFLLVPFCILLFQLVCWLMSVSLFNESLCCPFYVTLNQTINEIMEVGQSYTHICSKSFMDKTSIGTSLFPILFPMSPSKTLGPDGMIALFFQKIWNVVGNDVWAHCIDIQCIPFFSFLFLFFSPSLTLFLFMKLITY